MQPRVELGRVVADDGVEPLAQHRLDRILPAGFDVDLPPQRHGAVEPVPAQPFRQPAALKGACLHLFERGAARLAGGQLALDALHFLLRLAPAGFELRQLRLQLLQVILVAGQFLAQQRQLFFLLGQIERIGRFLAARLVAQAVAALGDGLQGALRMRLVGQLDFEALLAVGRTRAQALQLLLRLGVTLLDLRRDVHLLVQALPGLVNAEAGDFLQFFPFLAVDRELLRRLAPLGQFPLELNQARLDLVARFAAMADFRLQPRHLGIRRVHLALRLVQRIAGGEVRFAGFLGARFGLAQRGVLRFQVDHRALDFVARRAGARPRPRASSAARAVAGAAPVAR